MHLAIQALSLLVYRHATETNSKQIFQIKVIQLKIPTGRRQTRWLFTKRDRGFELATTEKKNPASGRVEALNPDPPDYNTSALNHSATLPAKCTILHKFHQPFWLIERYFELS